MIRTRGKNKRGRKNKVAIKSGIKKRPWGKNQNIMKKHIHQATQIAS